MYRMIQTFDQHDECTVFKSLIGIYCLSGLFQTFDQYDGSTVFKSMMDIYCLSGLFFEDRGCRTGGWVCPNQLLLVRKGKSSLPSPSHINAQHQPRMCAFSCTVIHGHDYYKKKGRAFFDCHLHISDTCQVSIQGHYILTPLTFITTI